MSKLIVLNLGAGIQSTTLAHMAAEGEIEPMPDCAITADTQWERRVFYEHLAWLMSANVLPFPVHVVSAGNLRDDAIKMAHGISRRGGRPQPPFHIKNEDGSKGFISRQCTREYKIKPIMDKVRGLLGLEGRRGGSEVLVEQWIGISTDEASRCKPSQYSWAEHRWPLIEKRMSRGDCIEWLKRHDYPVPPKSSCIGCPFHSDHEWRALTAEELADAAEFEREMQVGHDHFGLRGVPYLHPSLIPINEVDFSTAEERGQLSMFNNECEGMCGV